MVTFARTAGLADQPTQGDALLLPRRHSRWLPPVVAVAAPDELADHAQLRRAWVARGDLAWVLVRQPSTKDTLAPLSQDLLAALGNVGLQARRAVGERHLLRALPYLLESPVRHVVLDEAQWLPEPVLHHVIDVMQAAGVTGWLLYEPPLLAYLPDTIADLFGGLIDHEHARGLLAQRPSGQRVHDAEQISAQWDRLPQRPVTCAHPTRVHCLGRSIGAAISGANLSVEEGQAMLLRVLDKGTTTVDEQWAARDFGLDTYTAAVTALRHILPSTLDPHSVLVHDLNADASAITTGASVHAVPPAMRAALRRQRHHSVHCNGPADFPLLTVFERPVEPRPVAERPLDLAGRRAVAQATASAGR